MDNSTHSKLRKLRASLPRLRELDRKKRHHPLSPEEQQQWQALYREALALFESRRRERIEQRCAVRIPCRIRVDYHLGNDKFHAMSHDFSALGIGIEFNHLIRYDMKCPLTIHLTHRGFWGRISSKACRVHGSVRSIDKSTNRIGFAFASPPKYLQRRIERTLYQHMETQIFQQIRQTCSEPTTPPQGK